MPNGNPHYNLTQLRPIRYNKYVINSIFKAMAPFATPRSISAGQLSAFDRSETKGALFMRQYYGKKGFHGIIKLFPRKFIKFALIKVCFTYLKKHDKLIVQSVRNI